ncbi:MAG TPA: sugar phosphate isomerase/epimerase family protein [Capsulimonadaceae bacterium]|nr:sugar phosphate isomerase/epimerase family protein [Capsulimonadaceae bacterium]
MMIPTLNGVTIGGAPPLPEYVALAEANGFGGVDFSIEEVAKLAEDSSWGAVRALFEQYEVQPATFGLPVPWRSDDVAYKEALARLPEYAKAAQEIGCSRCCTWLPPAVDENPEALKRTLFARFGEIARILGDQGIRFGVEFVGPYTLRHGPTARGAHPFIWTMAQVLDLIEEIDPPHDNMGLLLDSFHWYTNEGSVDNILSLAPAQVVHVHINDAPNKPVKEQIDSERLLPGEGVIDLAGFLSALMNIGYEGFAAVEVFNKELWALGPEAAAERTAASLPKVFASAQQRVK